MKYAYTGEKTIHVCSEFFVYYITLLYLLVHYLGFYIYSSTEGFPGGSDDKESACNAGDLGLIPGLGRSPGEGNGNPLQYSCLENPMDRGAFGLQFMRSQDSDMT